MNYSAIITLCKDGDPKAQKQLYEMFAPAMFAITLRYARSQEDAEDIFQQAFIKTYQKVGQLQDTAAFPGWIKSIFIREAIDFYRNSHQKQYFDDVETKNDFQTVENEAIENLNLSVIRNAINTLPDKCRSVFNLFVIDGYSHKEIGQMLQITEGTSKSQLFEAKKRLRELLSENTQSNSKTTA